MCFPSGLNAQLVTFVRAPRSFDLTTITVFCFRRFSISHILMFAKRRDLSINLRRNYLLKRIKTNDEPNGTVVRAGDELCVVFGVEPTRSEFRHVPSVNKPDKKRMKGHEYHSNLMGDKERERNRNERSMLHIPNIGIPLHILCSFTITDKEKKGETQ